MAPDVVVNPLVNMTVAGAYTFRPFTKNAISKLCNADTLGAINTHLHSIENCVKPTIDSQYNSPVADVVVTRWVCK